MRRTTCAHFIIQGIFGMKHIEVSSVLFLTSAPGPYHNKYLNSNCSLQMFEQLPEDVGSEDYRQLVKNSPHPNAVAARSEVTIGQHVKTQLRCTLPTKPNVRVPTFLHVNRLTHPTNSLCSSCNFWLVNFVVCQWSMRHWRTHISSIYLSTTLHFWLDWMNADFGMFPCFALCLQKGLRTY